MPDVRECLAHDVIHRTLAALRSLARSLARTHSLCPREALDPRLSYVAPGPCRDRATVADAPRRAAPLRAYARSDSTRSLSFSTPHHTSRLARAGLSARVGVIVFSSFPLFSVFFLYFFTYPISSRSRARALATGGKERESYFIFVLFYPFFLFTNRGRLRIFSTAGFQHPRV